MKTVARKKMKKTFSKQPRGKSYPKKLVIILSLVVVLFLTIITLQQPQDIRQEAAAVPSAVCMGSCPTNNPTSTITITQTPPPKIITAQPVASTSASISAQPAVGGPLPSTGGLQGGNGNLIAMLINMLQSLLGSMGGGNSGLTGGSGLGGSFSGSGTGSVGSSGNGLNGVFSGSGNGSVGGSFGGNGGNGINGINGANGINGSNGTNGSNGSNGANGINVGGN